MDIRNSVILITSAGSGLGSTLAVHFTSLGARVVVADTDSIALLDTVKRCRTLSDGIYYYPLPDHSSESIQSLFNYIDERFPNGVDVLINNYPACHYQGCSAVNRERSSLTSCRRWLLRYTVTGKPAL